MKCPACQSERVVEGNNFNLLGGGSIQYFRPKGLRMLVGSADVKVTAGFCACCDCGLLWSQVNAKELTRLLKQSGSEKTAKKLGLKNP
ncbi:MAG: hypothetical protein HY301_11205 [Verrucomicrobia bacterium]|nr:hypothetical protein [Verrucomicrobiota bacterium]